MRHFNPRFHVAVKEYKSGRFTNAELAERHKVSQSTISHWMMKAGLPPRRRGRHRLTKPNATHRRMLTLSARMTGEGIARRFGVSRQRVHHVLKRWDHLRPPRPFREELKHPQLPARRARELRATVVSFRLTLRQVERVNEFLSALELPEPISKNQACRLVLLAALGCGPTVVPEVANSVHATSACHMRDEPFGPPHLKERIPEFHSRSSSEDNNQNL